MLRRLATVALAYPMVMVPSLTQAAEITHQMRADEVGLINVAGPIEAGDLEKFRQISLNYKKATVTLKSNGGALLPALEIGKIIKSAGYDTAVEKGAVCASSCALIWVAGSRRWLSPEGFVGFHASYRDNQGRLEESGVANALIGSYLTLLNLPSNAIVFATMASPRQIMWLNNQNERSSGIDFEDLAPSGSRNLNTSPPAIMTFAIPARQAAANPQPSNSQNTPPQSRVEIIKSLYATEIDGEIIHSYQFKYLGLTLERIAGGFEPELQLQEVVDSQIRESPWLFYGVSGLDKSKDTVFYSIHIDSVTRINGTIGFWAKQEHQYDSTVPYRETKLYYNVYCKEGRLNVEEEHRYDRNGVNVFSMKYDYAPERIIPDTMGMKLWETVCG